MYLMRCSIPKHIRNPYNSVAKKNPNLKNGLEYHFSKEDMQMANRCVRRVLHITDHQGNANLKPQWDITLCLLGCLLFIKPRDNKHWWETGTWALLVGIQNSAGTIENNMDIPQKLKISPWYDLAVPFCIYVQKNEHKDLQEMHGLPCLSKLFLRQPRYGNNSNGHQQVNKESAYMYDGILFSLKRIRKKFCHLHLWMWRHYAKGDEIVTEGQILHNSTYRRYWK